MAFCAVCVVDEPVAKIAPPDWTDPRMHRAPERSSNRVRMEAGRNGGEIAVQNQHEEGIPPFETQH